MIIQLFTYAAEFVAAGLLCGLAIGIVDERLTGVSHWHEDRS